ncbi:MAG: trypsin-like serine protease, partial [Gemmatimonadetes bacterium]|nr:trypsin-like serine protease [Gemmatimonadota bacterium]
FSANVTEGAAPLEVRFDASASNDPDGNIVSYEWAFGDGSTGSGQTATYTYDDAGSYTPSLTVTDNRGASHSQNGAPITVNSPPGTGENEITGVVWHDADADGVRDEDEHTIPAVVVFLDENEDGLRDSTEATALTNDDGEYIFEGLDANRSYTVTQELTIGWTNTAPGRPADASEPEVAAIIGGEEAEPGEFPFQVALVTESNRFQFCGGTFIDGDWVMTAAHCVDDVQPEDFHVLAGAHNKLTDGELLDVERIYIHPLYGTQPGISSDIALLKLAGKHMHSRIELLTPDRLDLSAPGTIATTIGWGLTSDGGQSSAVLKKLEAEIISNDECQTHLSDNILDSTICAGKLGSNESICNGDSGGPLMVPYRNRWLQIGITSFGTNVCYQPTAFARVSSLVDYPIGVIPPELSGSVVVDWSSGGMTAEVNFGNFR